MDQSFDFISIFAFYWNYKPTVPDGDGVFLKKFLIGGGMDKCIQHMAGMKPCIGDLPPDFLQIPAGVVGQGILAEDSGGNGLLHLPVGSEAGKDAGKARCPSVSALPPPLAEAPDSAQYLCNM